MSDRDAKDLIEEADKRGLRRALMVTALGLEMDAVRAHLSEPCSVQGRDGSVYECGVFSEGGQDWLVVVVETGAGTHPAQSAVQNAHFALGEFEVQILVGIGGSRKEEDAPLGAVVASDHVYMPYGGKDTDQGRLSRPREFPVDLRLANLAKKVRRDRNWPTRIRASLHDELPDEAAYPFKMPPVGHVAPIASVEAVVAGRESELEAMLARDYNDTCVVEMEGYGAVYAAASERTPSLVIRGVSDLAKEKAPGTDRTRQPVAACHAAAFGFELLGQWGVRYRPPHRLVAFEGIPGGKQSHARHGPTPTDVLVETVPETADPPQVGAIEDGREIADQSPPLRRVIVNLDLDRSAATLEKISELQASLRRLTGSDALAIVSIEDGSVRLVVEDPSGALSQLDIEKLREGLESEDGVALLGRVEEPEYRELVDVEQQLRIASGDLMSWPTTLPDGEWIDRPELARLVDIIRGNVRSTTALLGQPGSGKSALLAALSAHVAASMKWPVLAIKADLLPVAVATEDQLAEYLGLPSRPSEMLMRLAKLRPVVLVIDQLDALAAYLDLKTDRLNVLMNLVRRLGEIDNISIVLSSRTFEFEHDVRLRTIRAQDIRLELPNWGKVSEILKAHGVEADGWPEDAQAVMRSPQALTTYLGLDRTCGAPMFVTYQAMLERLWAERVTAGQRGTAKSRLVSTMAEQMASDETLWLPRIRFEDHEEDVKALESAGILTPLGGAGSLGFTHQTLFDHALARSFARTTGRLSQYVLDRQESLFLRPKLWAALTYLRGVDPVSYSSELEAIWTAQGLRRHLRLLLIDFIGQQPVPTDREALLMDRALNDPQLRAIALKALSGSAGWFTRLAEGRIAESMSSDPALTRTILISAWSHAPRTVVKLIADRWLPHPESDQDSWIVLQYAPIWPGEALEVAKTILSRTEIASHYIDYVIGSIGTDQPTEALQLAKFKLDYDLKLAVAESEKRAAEKAPDFATTEDELAWKINRDVREPLKRLLEGSQEWNSMPALAERWPQQFVEILWPWFLDAFSALRRLERERQGYLGYDVQWVADFRFEGENDLELPEPVLLESVRIATETLAMEQPEAFEAWVQDQANIDATPVHRLIAHVMATQPERWANSAFHYLMGDTRRWYLGSSQDITGTTTRLIKRTSDHWQVEDLAAFVAAVLAYRPPPPAAYDTPKDRRGWMHGIRRLQLDLLRALPRGKAGSEARKKIEEESRVFPAERNGVYFSGASWVGSRMDANAMEKATDAEILNAFRTLPDATGWHHPTDWMSGGNIQLAREFANFSKSNADRAFNLIAQLTPEIGTRAAAYALDALAEEHDAIRVQHAFIELVGRSFDGEEFRTSTSSAIERLVRRKLTIEPDAIAALEGWARAPIKVEAEDKAGEAEGEGEDTDIDTGAETATKNSAKSDEDAPTRSMLWGYGGISILPGGDYPVLSALIHIRLARNEADALIDTLEQVLERSDDPRLWGSLLPLIQYLRPGVPDRRPELIQRIFETAPSILTTKGGVQLIAYSQWWSDDIARVQLARDVWGETASGRQSYGELVGLISVVRPELEWPRALTAELLSNFRRVDERAGAALSAVNVWSDPKHRRAATDLLVELISHDEPGVWAAVFDLFRLVDGLSPDVDTVRLLTALADHITTAPRISATFVVERLQTLLPHEADLVGRIALGLVGVWGSELGDIRSAHALAATELIDLAVTLHRLGPETRDLGTRLFEELLSIDGYSARETLDQIDNRFRAGSGPSRPRLKRRAVKSRRSVN